ncbi:hypothetical protein K438DRAFT_1828870, partial [Mycena galopus ATCC 62051]
MRRPRRRRRMVHRVHVGGAHSSEVVPVARGRRRARRGDVAPERCFLRCKTESNASIVECDHSTPKNSITSSTSISDPKGECKDHPIDWSAYCGFASQEMTPGNGSSCGGF